MEIPVLILDDFPQDFVDALETLPLQVDYRPDIRLPEVEQIIDQYEILIMRSKVSLTPALADLASKLKLVLRAGVGLDHIAVPYLEQKGVQVYNTIGANADSVGEHTLGMLLGLLHNLYRADAEVRRFVWKREANRGIELSSLTVGIIGYGHTGSAFARKIRGFGCKVLAYDKYKSGFGNEYVTETSLEKIQAEADVLSLHIPLTEETHHWVNKDFFSAFQKNIFFLNLSRGPIMELEEVIAAIQQGKIIKAGLDVLENENFNKLSEAEKALYQRLFELEDVVLSPHIGGWSVQSLENINLMVLDHVKKYLQSRALL